MRNLFLALFCLVASMSYGQEDKPMFYRHQLGLQANALLHQILSLGTNDPVDNPYLLRYAYHLSESSAITAGFGADIDQTEQEEGGAFNKRYDLDFRVGYLKRYALGDFNIGLGFDLAMQGQRIKSQNVQVFNSGPNLQDSTVFSTSDRSNRFGGGLRLTASYQITSQITVGTEAMYYLLLGSDKVSTTTKRYEFRNGATNTVWNNDSETNNILNFELTVPTAIFLSFRF